MAREAGANKVYFASAAPPVRYPNVYGIDMPAKEEFIANNRTIKQIETAIGADWLVYQDLEDLVEATCDGADVKYDFDCSVFNGEYVTGDINEEYLENLQTKRNDAKKKANNAESGIIDIHNDETAE
jgi:amidophosphoribosyltransferase